VSTSTMRSSVYAIPPRQPCVSTCDTQIQSPLLSILPGEIRNAIYQYVFTPATSEPDFASAYPLSLLLTCHRINHEASTLAFHYHNFELARNDRRDTFIAKRASTAHLSTAQVNTISMVSCDLRRDYTARQNAIVAPIICNTILMFQSLARFEIRIMHGKKSHLTLHGSRYHPRMSAATHDLQVIGPSKYAPIWFSESIVKRITGRETYAWQDGEHWDARWPQLEHDEYLDLTAGTDAGGRNVLIPNMSVDAVGNLRGVHMCPCSCGEVCWLSVDLVQQTGRTVAIDTVFYGQEEKPLAEVEREIILRSRVGLDVVILTPGVTSASVESSHVSVTADAGSISYNADEEYWEALRRKN
jgi:hypothetical protein